MPSVSEVYGLSILPPGGSPEMDAAYERWLRGFVADVNMRWLDEHTGYGRELPRQELLRTYAITGHLLKYLNGGKPFVSGEGLNHCHRIRFCAVQFHYRRAELIAEAERYATELADSLQEA